MEDESYTDKIQKFLKIGNYHAAVNIAISALNECRRTEDPAGVDKFVNIIKGISLTIEHEFGSQKTFKKGNGEIVSCFLCGKTADKTPLLFGAKVGICAKCAKYAHGYFTGSGEE